MVSILKLIGLILAIIVPGGFIVMGLVMWLGPRILVFMLRRFIKAVERQPVKKG